MMGSAPVINDTGPKPKCDPDAVKAGAEIYERARENWLHTPFYGQVTLDGDFEGKEGFLAIFVRFYQRLHQDPSMRTLFVESPEERPAEEHGRLLGLALLQRINGDQEYRHLHGNIFHRINHAHARSKRCPFRHPEHRGRGFTVSQRNAWLGHMHGACTDRNISKEASDNLVVYLASFIDFYAPFIED